MKSLFAFTFLVSFSLRIFAQSPGSLDLSFDPGAGPGSVVESIAVQDDGHILIGGPFSSYDGTPINGIARLNPDGSLDTTFNPGAGVMGLVAGQQYHVYDIAVQDDGKIILVGAFHNFDNTPRNRIVRLNPDGSLDTSFDPGAGADGTLRTIELLSNGQMLIAGSLTYYNGYPNDAPFIARINSDGTQDNTFDPGDGANSTIHGIGIQADGKLVIVGDFTIFDGVSLNRIARLNADGSLDGSFNPGTGSGGTFPSIRDVALQNDGKIVITGYFDSYDGTTRGKIARLNTDGSLDGSFDPGTGADLNSIHRVEILSGNSMILVGGFYTYDGVSRNSIVRIAADGSLDTGFDPGFGCNNTGESLALQSDGKILIGGNFIQYDGTPRNYLARIHNDAGATAVQSVDVLSSLNAYPNPSQGIFRLQTSEDMPEYRITDMTGKVIVDHCRAETVDLSRVPAGVYILRSSRGDVLRLIRH